MFSAPKDIPGSKKRYGEHTNTRACKPAFHSAGTQQHRCQRAITSNSRSVLSAGSGCLRCERGKGTQRQEHSCTSCIRDMTQTDPLNLESYVHLSVKVMTVTVLTLITERSLYLRTKRKRLSLGVFCSPKRKRGLTLEMGPRTPPRAPARGEGRGPAWRKRNSSARPPKTAAAAVLTKQNYLTRRGE